MGSQRYHKYKSDFGMSDYRKFYKEKYNSDIEAKKYSEIIHYFNDRLTDLIVEKSIAFTIPYLLLEISIRKMKMKPKIVSGKLINNNPINWKATNKLWEENKEAKDKKLLIRYNNYNTSGYVFRIYCKKFKSKLKFRNFYKMKANRKFQKKLKKRIEDPNKDNYDAFLLYKTRD